MSSRLLLGLLFTSTILSAPSLMRIPTLLPLTDAQVRAVIPEALQQLREQGLWLVNTDLHAIERTQDAICVVWTHQYRSGKRTLPQELLTTCVP